MGCKRYNGKIVHERACYDTAEQWHGLIVALRWMKPQGFPDDPTLYVE